MFSSFSRSIVSTASKKVGKQWFTSSTRGSSRGLHSAAKGKGNSNSQLGTLLGLSLGLSLGFGTFITYQRSSHLLKAAETPIFGLPGTNQERTFIAVKPDGVHRGLIGDIISRFEQRGYKLVGLKVVVPSLEFAAKHYDDLKSKPFFPSLIKYFSSGPVVAMVWEGRDVIVGGRTLVGATNPAQAEPGSIRGDFAIQIGRNIVHGSDSPASAQAEISLWFQENEVASYQLSNYKWIYE